jgi:hypothetical protein
MNTKIFALLIKNLEESFKLPKYDKIRKSFDSQTVIDELPWTPARFDKFKERIEQELDLSCEFVGTVWGITNELDIKYSNRFFGEIWKPQTEMYSFTGWNLVDEINKLNPNKVLDVGCGYNQFKGRINNLIGIDPYNNCADYQIDILEFVDDAKSYDVIIALGSINFNSLQDIEARMYKCVQLLSDNGKMFFRVNPGIPHQKGPYVDIFPWNFEIVKTFAKQFNLTLETFKKDSNSRLYFVYSRK